MSSPKCSEIVRAILFLQKIIRVFCVPISVQRTVGTGLNQTLTLGIYSAVRETYYRRLQFRTASAGQSCNAGGRGWTVSAGRHLAQSGGQGIMPREIDI